MRLLSWLHTRHVAERATREIEARSTTSLKVAIIGTPNVGKSALTNQLVKADLCAVSKLIDTTRRNMVTSYSEGFCQLVVIDSPGLIGLQHAKKVVGTHSNSRILVDPENALSTSGHVVVVCDATAPGEYIHHRVLHLLHRNSHVPSTLVLNKCDLIKQRSSLLRRAQLLTNGTVDGVSITMEVANLGKLARMGDPTPKDLDINPLAKQINIKDETWQQAYNKILNKPTHKCTWQETKNVFKTETGWSHFSALFFASAHTGDGIEPLRKHLQKMSAAAEWKFEPNVQTKKRPQSVVVEHIRSALLNNLPSDIAYKLKASIIHWEMETSGLSIIAHINCEKERWGKMVTILFSTQTAVLEQRFSKLFNCNVQMEILAKVDGKIVKLS